MRPTRFHGNRRSSTYSSAISTIIFVALCVFGVWMLTSDSVVPPQTTTRAATTITTASDSRNDNNHEPEALDPRSTTEPSSSRGKDQAQKPEAKSDKAVYEDNPGRLPDDAIKSDEPQKSQQEYGNADGKEKQQVSGVKDHSQGIQGMEHGEEKERQRQGETQISEESTMQMEVSNDQKSNNSDEMKQENASGRDSAETIEDERMDKQMQDKKGDSRDQEPNEATEYEKEQRQQRKEDAGDVKVSRDSRENDDQQKEPKTREGQEEEQKSAQEQVSSTGVTFNDSTKEQLPVEQGLYMEVTQIQNSTNADSGQQEQKDQQRGDKTNAESLRATNSFQSLSDVSNSDKKSSTFSGESNSSSNTGGFSSVGTSLRRQKPDVSKGSGESNSEESSPSGENFGTLKESTESKKGWKTQATESKNEKRRQKDEIDDKESTKHYRWHLCDTSAGADYIPCLDNEEAIMKLQSRKHFEHRERHCPEKPPVCLVPLPKGYKEPIKWPKSREKIWYHNVPHVELAKFKGHQNWVKVAGECLTFPGGGTQFIHGAFHYIDFLQKAVPNIAWGNRTRVVLDIGCGVASFGGYLFDRDVLTMSFAPKDEHEAQVQFALERGIPAISAVMGSQRLPYPARVFDLVHCARCRVPWHNDGGLLLLEVNRVLRPGGYFVWSATPVYQKLPEDEKLWKEMSSLTASMCLELVTVKKDELNRIGAAIYRKPVSNDCYENRDKKNPPMCKNDDDPNAAWYVPLQPCMHRIPPGTTERGSKWPKDWPHRLEAPPYWLNASQIGIYGKPSPQDFATDYEHWKQVVTKVYMNELGIKWFGIRNAMDMRAVYGGFAAALRDQQLWVMNVVTLNSPDTLPIIYERGLFGMYHDWCEPFSTYPRSYDLLHADHLFSKLKGRCDTAPVIVEIDRIVRPGGRLIVRDDSGVVKEVENLLKSLAWKVYTTSSKNQEGILSAQKGFWRPEKTEASS